MKKNQLLRLTPLRKQINYLDTLLTKIFKKRSFIIPKVRLIKHGWYYKIAFRRELEMAKKIATKDFGLYNSISMQKIWREIISATLYIECKLPISIFKADNYVGLWEVTKDHWGVASNMMLEHNYTNILKNLVEQKIELAIMPYPHNTTVGKNWWLDLLKPENKNIRINLELPNIKGFNTLSDTKALCLSLNTVDKFTDIMFYILDNNDKILINANKNINILDKVAKYSFISVKNKVAIKNGIYVGSSPLQIE